MINWVQYIFIYMLNLKSSCQLHREKMLEVTSTCQDTMNEEQKEINCIYFAYKRKQNQRKEKYYTVLCKYILYS
jgi:hypothetical protein